MPPKTRDDAGGGVTPSGARVKAGAPDTTLPATAAAGPIRPGTVSTAPANPTTVAMAEQPAAVDPTPPASAPAPQPRRRSLGKLLVAILLVLVVAGVAAAAILYAIDYEVEATVQGVDCAAGTVEVTTKLFGIDHTVTGVPRQQCIFLSPGNFVEYHVRSTHTRLYDVEGGDCIYDSVTGVC